MTTRKRLRLTSASKVLLASAFVMHSGASANDVQVDANGRLSVEVRDTDPVVLMQRISERAGFKLVVSDGVQPPLGSWSFSGVPLETAINRVLVHLDYILIRGDVSGSGTGIDRVWILSKSTPTTQVSVTRASRGADPTLDQPPLAEALEAIAEIARTSDTNRSSRLLTFLAHPDKRARTALARALGQAGDQEAVLALGQLVYGDAEPAVRRAAATALAKTQSPEAIDMLRGALEDEDPLVQKHVSRILADLDEG